MFSYILYRSLDICYFWSLLKLEHDRATHKKNKTPKQYALVIENVLSSFSILLVRNLYKNGLLFCFSQKDYKREDAYGISGVRLMT